MLDMGFKPAVDRIVAMIPKRRQTLFFSATLEGAAGALATTYTRDARRHVHAPKPEPGRAAITHRFVEAASQSAKVDLLVAELADRDRGRTLVFVRTKRGADRLVKKLRARHVEAVAMHGDKSQSQRQRALARFERGEVTVLIATDVAARGIDVPEVTHVINFDAPADGDAYTHRVGRTGRAGATGSGISFILADQVHEMRRMARGLDLAAEFDRREGAGRHKPAPDHPGGGRRHAGPQHAKNRGSQGSGGHKRRRRSRRRAPR
jgi:superfamily II DNA/RNA helicase